MENKKGLYPAWLGLLGILILVGLFTTVRLFVEGHGLFNANDVLIWTLPLGGYIFLALTSSGLTLLAGIPLVFGVRRYEPFAKRLVFLSVATLIGAFVCIGLELGSVFHMIYIMISPNPSSPIWWMGAIYSLELLLLAGKFWKMHRGDWHGGLSKALGVTSFLCAVVAPLMIGSVFGLTESRVTYFGPIMAIYSLLMALLSGSALFILYTLVYQRFAGGGAPGEQAPLLDDFTKIFSYTLGFVVLFTLLKFSMESVTTIPDFLVYRRFEHAFGAWRVFHTEVVLGLFLPFLLMAIPSFRARDGVKLLASSLCFAGALAMHMEILLAGQSRPVGPKAEQFPEFISYSPSIWEWTVLLFGLAVMVFLCTLGERHLKLEAAPQ